MSQRSPALRDQQIFMSELLAERIESGPHAARFFLYLTEMLDLQMYKKLYMGTPPYNRPTLLATILYSMYMGIFESQNIVKYAMDSIGAQWILNGMEMPKYKTVQNTINALLEELDDIFVQILSICEHMELIGGVLGYTDGVKVQANASKHKAMSYGRMGKKISRGKEDLKELFAALREIVDEFELPEGDFHEIAIEDAADAHKGLLKIHDDALKNRQEQIFNRDLGEIAGLSEQEKTKEESRRNELKAGLRVLENVEPERQDGALAILNNIGFINKRVSRMEDAKSELENRWKKANGNKQIPETQQINFTDPDSGIMTTKHFGVQQCYNNFAVVDAKANIILGYYTSNNPVDQLSLKPLIERTEQIYGSLEGFQFGTDAGFFSAGNILYMKGKEIDFYASYPEAKWGYAKDKFKYDEHTDTYTCPGGHILLPPKGSRGGETRQYSNEAACNSCEFQKDCTKAKDGVRRINRDMEDDKLREEGREKANSPEGREILRLRKSIPEPVWGNIKTQDNFIQMHFRGIEKAGLEFGLHCLMQNIRKLLKVYFKSKSYQNIVHNKIGGCCYAAA
jgi:transposase